MVEVLRQSRTPELKPEPLRLATLEVVKLELLLRQAESRRPDLTLREHKVLLRLNDLMNLELSQLLLNVRLSRELNLLRLSVRLNLGHSQVALLDL